MTTSDIPIIVLDGKLAGESAVYSITFDDLAAGASITAHLVTTTNSNGTVETSDVSGRTVRARIGAGEAGTTIQALFRATGSDGQVLQCWAIIPVIAAPE